MPVGPLHNDAQVKPVGPVGSALFPGPYVNTAEFNGKRREKHTQNFAVPKLDR